MFKNGFHISNLTLYQKKTIFRFFLIIIYFIFTNVVVIGRRNLETAFIVLVLVQHSNENFSSLHTVFPEKNTSIWNKMYIFFSLFFQHHRHHHDHPFHLFLNINKTYYLFCFIFYITLKEIWRWRKRKKWMNREMFSLSLSLWTSGQTSNRNYSLSNKYWFETTSWRIRLVDL